MKFNLTRYLREYGGKSFHEAPFSEVDALVMAQLSYLKMKGIVPDFGSSPGVGWEEMRQHPDSEHMFADPIYGRQHRCIFELVRKSRRYRHVKANYYTEWFDEKKEAQFAAVTFFLGATSIYVSFRGTDETIIGWKEDFNMGFMKSIPSQKKALAYLKGVARYTEQGRLILGGHSKGGNLAIYAAACAPPHIQRRIRRVYSFDGPGFRKQFYEQAGFMRIEDRYSKIMPEQSLIGMLLKNYRNYRVVQSYRAGVMQHDLLQWKIRNGKFIYRKQLYGRSGRKSRILNDWMDSLNQKQISFFVETLYELLRDAKVQSVYEIVKKPFQLLGAVCRSFRMLDREHRRAFWQIVRKLFEAAFS